MLDFFRKHAERFGYADRDGGEDYYGDETQRFAAGHNDQTQVVELTKVPADRTDPIQPVEEEQLSRIVRVNPENYAAVTVVGDYLMNGDSVIMNLREMEKAEASRVVDFTAGLIYALHGTIERMETRVFLLTPHAVSVDDTDA